MVRKCKMFQLNFTYRFYQILDKRMRTFSQNLVLMMRKKKMMMMLVSSIQLHVVYSDFLTGNRSVAVNLEVRRGASRLLVSILLHLLDWSLEIVVRIVSYHEHLRRINSILDNVY